MGTEPKSQPGRNRRRWVTWALSVMLLCLARNAGAGYVAVPGASFGNFNVKVMSIQEAKFRTVIRQQYDFSCGSAVLATLLTYHYADPVNEQEIFKEMYEKGNKAKINKDGFSLLDIKKYLERRGYVADGFKMTLDDLRKNGLPTIVLIKHNSYKHFVVLKGISDKEVLLGDPAAGTRVVANSEFEQMFNGVAFIVRNKRKIGASHFNLREDWHVKEKAPVASASAAGQPANFLSLFLSEKLGL